MNAGLTQDELCRYTGLSKRYIVSLEQTIPSRPSPLALSVLSQYTPVGIKDILMAYRKEYQEKEHFIINKIKEARLDLDFILEKYKAGVKSGNNPVRTLRVLVMHSLGLSISQIKFCTYFSVHPAVLSEAETRGGQSLPISLQKSFILVGFNEKQLKKLEKDFVKWTISN